MKGVVALIAALLLLSTCTPALAQRCRSNIPPSTSVSRYHDHGDGSVTDTRTGLRWARCSLGQHWREGRCQGEAQRLNWSIAALSVETEAEAGWRLPELAELSSLTELACRDPAINSEIFPQTQAAPYWTATRFINADGSFWQVHFLDGESLPDKADSRAYVRLVRSIATSTAE
jgi:hypothetical protein